LVHREEIYQARKAREAAAERKEFSPARKEALAKLHTTRRAKLMKQLAATELLDDP
jgi:hypothetical protein